MTESSARSSLEEAVIMGNGNTYSSSDTTKTSRPASAGFTLATMVSLSPAVSAFQFRPNSSHLKTHRSPDTLSPKSDSGSPEMQQTLSNHTRSPSPVSPRPSASILKDGYVYKDEVFILDEKRKEKLRQVGEIGLQSEWTFWYDRYVPNLPATEYEANLQVISTVGTVQKFWSVYNNIDGPDRLGFRSNLHFMRKGIKPIWEDPQNEHGGSFNFKIAKGQSSLFWRDLLVLLIGEKVEGWLGDTVCGLSVSSRNQCDNYQVWVAQNHHNDPERDLRIKATLADMLGPTEIQSFYYKVHKNHAAFQKQKWPEDPASLLLRTPLEMRQMITKESIEKVVADIERLGLKQKANRSNSNLYRQAQQQQQQSQQSESQQ